MSNYNAIYTKSYIINQLEKLYPDKKIVNLRSNYPNLYAGIRNYCKRNNISDFYNLLNSLGYNNISNYNTSLKYTKEYIVNQLERYYPDKNIKKLSTKHLSLHNGIKYYCKRNKITNYFNFLESLGYNVEKLKKSNIKYTKKYISKKLKEMYPNMKITQLTDNQKLYYGIKKYCKRNEIEHYEEFLKTLGYTIMKNVGNIIYKKEVIIKELEKKYPNNEIKRLTDNNKLYEGIIRYCERNNIEDYREFLKSLGYKI